MLETRAIVIHTDDLSALIQADQINGCEQCNGKGCGSSKLTEMFCSKPKQFLVDNSINAKVGDAVVVAVADGAVMRGIGLAYLLPLFFLIAGATLGSFYAARPGLTDGYAAGGALLGFALGLVAAKWLASKRARHLDQPVIVRLWREGN